VIITAAVVADAHVSAVCVAPFRTSVPVPVTQVTVPVGTETVTDVAELDPIIIGAPFESRSETLINLFPHPESVAAPAPATALLIPPSVIVLTLKYALALTHVSAKAVVIDVSHAIVRFDPCPNSNELPLLRVTLAASVVATSGPIVAIRKPAIIFLLR